MPSNSPPPPVLAPQTNKKSWLFGGRLTRWFDLCILSMFMVHSHGHGHGAMSSVCLYECMVCTACTACNVCTEWVPMYLVGMVSVWCIV